MASDEPAKASVSLRDLNFKVEPKFHRNFKLVAALRGMTMKELLEKSFECWVEHNANDQVRDLLRNSSKK
jgi:predicted HicB family RNase H-like nuclease